MVVKTANMSWGTNLSPIINVADKTDIPSSSYPVKSVATYNILANSMQRTDRKARINLPPIRPSRGPIGRIDLIIP